MDLINGHTYAFHNDTSALSYFAGLCNSSLTEIVIDHVRGEIVIQNEARTEKKVVGRILDD